MKSNIEINLLAIQDTDVTEQWLRYNNPLYKEFLDEGNSMTTQCEAIKQYPYNPGVTITNDTLGSQALYIFPRFLPSEQCFDGN
jgi:hypothetical protein